MPEVWDIISDPAAWVVVVLNLNLLARHVVGGIDPHLEVDDEVWIEILKEADLLELRIGEEVSYLGHHVELVGLENLGEDNSHVGDKDGGKDYSR
jgi:hypothetical protein